MKRMLSITLAVGLAAAGLWAAEETKKAEEDGWKPLFNGKDLDGWMNSAGEAPGDGWKVEEGALVRAAKAGDVWTRARYGDFVLDLEFMTEGNSGIFIRTDNPKDCVQTGIEVQVLGPVASPGKHSCGAIYDCLAPTKDVVKKGEWNRITITAAKNKIAVVMNGEQIIDMDLDKWTEPRQNPDGSKNKFSKALKDFSRVGHIGLQDHGAKVSYRNIRLKDLAKPSEKKEEGVSGRRRGAVLGARRSSPERKLRGCFEGR